MSEDDFNFLINEVKTRAEQDDTDSQISLAGIYEKGLGPIQEDKENALRYIQLAADNKSAEALWLLGKYYETPPSPEHKGLEYIKSAAQLGNAKAQLWLDHFEDEDARAVSEKRLADMNATFNRFFPKRAKDLIHSTHVERIASAMEKGGVPLLLTLYPELNDIWAFQERCYTSEAMREDQVVQLYLGIQYALRERRYKAFECVSFAQNLGKGIERILEKVGYTEKVFNCHQNAKKGDVEAQMRVAFMYKYGLCVLKDCRKAFKYYKRAADAGGKPAEFIIGFMYINGLGIEKNYEESFNYFNLFASQTELADNFLEMTYTIHNDSVASDFSRFCADFFYSHDREIYHSLIENDIKGPYVSRYVYKNQAYYASPPKVEIPPHFTFDELRDSIARDGWKYFQRDKNRFVEFYTMLANKGDEKAQRVLEKM